MKTKYDQRSVRLSNGLFWGQKAVSGTRFTALVRKDNAWSLESEFPGEAGQNIQCITQSHLVLISTWIIHCSVSIGLNSRNL